MRLAQYLSGAAVWLLLLAVGITFADPCGMVPPVYTGTDVPLARIGEQQTYVFFQDGVESFVIRPGFRGKVEEFGMLIPFPTPPAVRKVSDDIFGHIAAAVDPPEVVIYNYPMRGGAFAEGGSFGAEPMAISSRAIRRDEVRVIKEEAVGMYEVAVLEAGSAGALKKWMDQHEYRFPDGMEPVCREYVEDKWCFVAVKTRIGAKSTADPAPGRREAGVRLPEGGSFDGFVQAMGFRFRTEELVVPMRLSAFNDGELRNIVYLLTEGPRRIRHIPEEYVVRQLDGEQLVKNLTQPLPLRIVGGKLQDLGEWQKKGLPKRRDPEPKNGAAKRLFAGDLVAVETGKLSLAHEEKEKELLRIGEALGLRGPAMDRLNEEQMKSESEKTVAASLENLKKMTLTVVDGDFPREVLAGENLTFAEFSMPAEKNNAANYDATLKRGKPDQFKGQKSILIFDRLGDLEVEPRRRPQVALASLGVIPLILISLGWWFWGRSDALNGKLLSCFLMLGLTIAICGISLAEEPSGESIQSKVAAIADRAKENGNRDAAIDELMSIAQNRDDILAQGWAIVALGELGGMDVDERLLKIQSDSDNPSVVRTWAAASRVSMVKSPEALIEKARLIGEFPALARPIGKRLVEAMRTSDNVSAEMLLETTIRVPQVAASMAPTIMSLGASELVSVMTTADDQRVRNQAAAYLASLGGKDSQSVAQAVVDVYRFDASASEVPWKGGPLFVPGIQWNEQQARQLVRELVGWHIWSDREGRTDLQRQIHNNLRSVNLSRQVGYQTPNFQFAGAPEWLAAWGKAVGKQEAIALAEEAGVQNIAKYRRVLKRL